MDAWALIHRGESRRCAVFTPVIFATPIHRTARLTIPRQQRRRDSNGRGLRAEYSCRLAAIEHAVTMCQR
jgi:hypothetical protein